MALAVTAVARGDDHDENKTTTHSSSSTDKHTAAFLKDACKDNAMEISLASLAQAKTQNSEVKAFAEHLVKDHTAAKQKLDTLKQTHGMAAAKDPDKADKNDKKLDKFQTMSGSEFDKAFMTTALRMHQKDIAKFEKASEQVQANDVKEFITSTLPKLRSHQQHAVTVAQAVGVDQATITALTKQMSEDAVGGTREGGIEDTADNTFDGSDEAGLKNQKGDGAHRLTDKDKDLK